MSSDSRFFEVINLKKYYSVSSGLLVDRSREKFLLKAVDGVSFEIREGETFGLVGESGCGKSTIAKSIVKLERPTYGEIRYRGGNINLMNGEEDKWYKKEVQMVFQDPNSSLDPRMTVGDSVEEAFIVHKMYEGDKEERRERVKELFASTGLKPDYLKRHPHELSGGEKQRVGIARALAVDPKLIIADEPVSALDISVRAQILNLFLKLKEERGLSYLFIAHDLSVIRHISERVAIMFRGRIVEMADTEDVFEEPLHPYTKILLQAIPGRWYKRGDRGYKINTHFKFLSWEEAKGCAFYSFCKNATEKCNCRKPKITEVKKRHFVSCLN